MQDFQEWHRLVSYRVKHPTIPVNRQGARRRRKVKE